MASRVSLTNVRPYRVALLAALACSIFLGLASCSDEPGPTPEAASGPTAAMAPPASPTAPATAGPVVEVRAPRPTPAAPPDPPLPTPATMATTPATMLAWEGDGLNDLEQAAARSLSAIEAADRKTADAVQELSWLGDELTLEERLALQRIEEIAAEDGALAQDLLNLPWVADEIADDELLSAAEIRDIARQDISLARQVVNAPWVADGLNANERQTIAVIGDAARENVSEAQRLLEFPGIPTTDTGGGSYPFDFLRHIYLDSFNEEFPELASVLYSFPGFDVGRYRTLIQTVSSLLRIARQDEEMARVVLGWPWVADGVTSDERDSLVRISRTIELEPSLARLVLDFPWIADGINDVEQQALSMGWQVAGNDPEQARLLFRQGWFQDGVSEEEAALLVALKSASSWTSFSNELIETGQVQSQLIALPAGDVKVFVVSRSPLEEAAEHVFRGLGEGIEAIEHFMGAPWARAKVIVYLEPELQYITEVAGFNAGSHIVIRGVSEREWRNYVIYHELAHFYFGYRNSPKWLAEGGANFLEAYTLHFGGGIAMKDLYQYARRGVAWSCLPEGITNVNDWNEATAGLAGSEYHLSPLWRCTYPIGETFLLGMYDSLGHATVEAALRALHRRGQRSFYPASEDDVYTIFLRSTPAEDRNAFEDTYFCLHGREMPGFARSPACEVYTPIPTPVYRADLEIFTPITPVPTPGATPMPAPSATPEVLDRGMAADRAALVAFYHATGGRDWERDDSWLSGAPMGEWYGVETDDNGRVVGIDLRENSLSGQIPGELGGLTNLQWLFLNNDAFSCQETPCRATSPTANRLTGTIPPELGQLANLESLYLALNPLTGAIPTELAALAKLRELGLWISQLSGEIPSWLGDLVNLEIINLAANNFSGPIPVELGDLTNLNHLELSVNQLTGTIPASLGDLTRLEHLGLNSNQLTGSIPASLGNLANLNSMYITGNELGGCIPAGLKRVPINYFEGTGLPFCSR